MTKKFTLSIALACLIGATATADEVKILNFGSGGTPGMTEPMMMGLGISPNGKYVCGSIGFGYFMGDLETNNVFYEMTDDDEGAELRNVSNNGVAIGYNGPGVTFTIDKVETVLKVPNDEYRYVLGEAITNDASMYVGSLVTEAGFVTQAAYAEAEGEWTLLPLPSDEEIGVYAGNGSAAKYVSGDGKYILGFVGSFGPAVLWTRNDDGGYDVDPIFTKYCMIDRDEEGKQFSSFNPVGISNNGKYVLILACFADEGSARGIPVVYNTETKDLTVYGEKQEIDGVELGLTPSAISDDGTIVGFVGTLMYNTGAFVLKADESQAVYFAKAYPNCAELFEIMDMLYFNVPTGISADGKYVVGYGLLVDDPQNLDEMAYYVTYVLDTYIDPAAIEVVAPEREGEPVAVGFYGIDGRCQKGLTKGINIVKMSDGTTRKVMER